MKSNLLAGSLCAAGIIIPQIIFAGDKNREVTPDKPNIIFILADDMGYGDLSCYGNQYVKTPNIDRLAETGTRFNQCYAGSGISSPSRCALMTGKNTGNTRIRDNMCTAEGIAGIKINPNGDSTIVRRANLLQQDTTIATVLSAAGYRTCLVNKWHLDGYEKRPHPTIADLMSSMGGLSLQCTVILLIIIPITVFMAIRSSISLKMQMENMASTIMT